MNISEKWKQVNRVGQTFKLTIPDEPPLPFISPQAVDEIYRPFFRKIERESMLRLFFNGRDCTV